MKKIIAVLLVLLTLASFAACGKKPAASFDREGYKVLLDESVKLYSDFSREQVEKVCHPNEIAYKTDMYRERKDADYIELLGKDLEAVCEKYDELYGTDWKITYTIREAVEKDEKGIEQYKQFDHFYFEEYNIDTDAFQAVTFAKVTVHIEGSKGSFDKNKTIQCFCIDGTWYSLYAFRIGLALADSSESDN